MRPRYDAIVVGAGAGGGVAAGVLAAAGKSVLLIERGRAHGNEDRRDHLRNHRLPVYGDNAGLGIEGHPRVLVDAEGAEHVLKPHEAGYHNNAAAVGAGTLLYGGLAWRYLRDDFRMASKYGVPAGSSLVDWPFGYDDLAPFYDRIEWDIGVAGDGEGNRYAAPRERGYPMPPVPRFAAGAALAHGAQALGIDTFTPPLLINTVPRDGRAACVQCGSCVGFPCPAGAKNGTQNTVIARALATGRCDLLTSAIVERVETGSGGRVTGVGLVETGPDGALRPSAGLAT